MHNTAEASLVENRSRGLCIRIHYKATLIASLSVRVLCASGAAMARLNFTLLLLAVLCALVAAKTQSDILVVDIPKRGMETS